MNSTRVRAFRKGDLKTVAQFHKQAFKDHINARLGDQYIQKFLSWFIDRPQCIAIVAVNADEQPIGYAVGGYWGYQNKLNRFLLAQAIFAIITHPAVFFHPRLWSALVARCKILLGLSTHVRETQKELEGKIISLVGIGIDNRFQRKGIGRVLLQAFEEESKNLQFDTFRLSVYKANQSARAFYEQNGWKLIEATTDLSVVAYSKKT